MTNETHRRASIRLPAGTSARPMVEALQPAMPGSMASEVRGSCGIKSRADFDGQVEGKEVTSLNEAFEERAAILQFDAGHSRKEAERLAAKWMEANK